MILSFESEHRLWASLVDQEESQILVLALSQSAACAFIFFVLLKIYPNPVAILSLARGVLLYLLFNSHTLAVFSSPIGDSLFCQDLDTVWVLVLEMGGGSQS